MPSPPAEAAQLTKSCSKLLESSGEASASTSTACQRNKAIASMHMRQGRAAVRTRGGCPETKGVHAYLVMHQYTPSDLQYARLGDLEFWRSWSSRAT